MLELEANAIKVDYSYDTVPTIREFTLSNKRIKGLLGPFGSGKSSGCLMEILRRAHEQVVSPLDGLRKLRCAVVRNTYPQLKDTTIKTVMDWLPPKYFGEYKIADHEYIITGFPGVRIELLFRALDKQEHVSNLLSLELTMAWINEAREVPRAIWDAIDGRIDRYPSMREGGATWCGIIMDTNPPDEDSEWFHFFEEDLPENAAIFKQPSGLAPEAENLPHLAPEYYQNLSVGKSREFNNVYVHGKYGYTRAGRPVYHNFNDYLHVSSKPLKPIAGNPLLIGFDFGLTPSAVICQQTARGQFLVLDEMLSISMGIRQFIRNILKPLLVTKYRGFPIMGVGDPAGTQRSPVDEKTCFQELRDAGIKIRPANTNSIVARTTAVEALLSRLIDGKPGFYLSPTCKMLRKGFNGSYKFAKIQGSNRYAEKPYKNDASHVHDALQYAAMYVDEAVRMASRPQLFRKKPQYVPVQTKGGY
jgi:hypothetical protein